MNQEKNVNESLSWRTLIIFASWCLDQTSGKKKQRRDKDRIPKNNSTWSAGGKISWEGDAVCWKHKRSQGCPRKCREERPPSPEFGWRVWLRDYLWTDREVRWLVCYQWGFGHYYLDKPYFRNDSSTVETENMAGLVYWPRSTATY